MKMKSFMRASLVMLMSLLVSSTMAQQRGQGQGMRNADPEAQANMQVEQLKKIVKVNAEEESKLKEVFLNNARERQTKMQEARDSGSREGMRDAFAKFNESRDAQLKKILGDKRMKKYQEELEKIRQERRGQRRF